MLAVTIASLSLGAISLRAGQESLTFHAQVSQLARLPYLLYLPASYDREGAKHWPLLVYLHGGSLRGNDTARLRTMGLPRRLETDANFPFVVVSPLCAEGEIWTDAPVVDALIEHVAREHNVDRDRIYITGHSMGGRGALYYAFRMPDRFAAVAALSPYGPITAWSKRLAQVPLWIVHGAKDEQAPLRDSEQLIEATTNAGGKPRFTSLPDRDHFLLDWFDRDELFDWLAQHRRDSVRPSENGPKIIPFPERPFPGTGTPR